MADLVIVGCGPVGAVAANLAGAFGLETVVVERADDVYDLPRAIHLDAHVMRILQQAGVADTVAAGCREWRRSTFYGADGEAIRVHEWPEDQPLGWAAHYLFYQPTFERQLRDRLEHRPEVSVRLGTEVVGLENDGDRVRVDLGDGTSVASDYVIGADGASSRVRTALGIGLVDLGFDEPWMVVDVLADREIGTPDESEMRCDPRRPATRVPGPGRHHRWEFMLLPGETPEAIAQPDSVSALLRPWVAADEVEIIRAAVYRFHALTAERWRDGRVFLAGDAAHQTPPFLGQGMCHGIRDVQNLIWKLAALCGDTDERLLDSYEQERRPHVETIVDMAVAAGRDICILDPDAAAERDARMRREERSGRSRKTTFQGMPPLTGGLFERTGAGELFPQPRVDGQRLDDVIGNRPAIIARPDVAAELSKTPSVAVIASDTVADDVVVLRPDRYVHATVRHADEALTALRELGAREPA